MRRYRWLTAAALVLVLVGGGVTSVIAARPAAVDAQQNEDYKRDILLCLDVSGSMVGVDAEIMRVFQNIVKGLNGERIGLRVFDASGYMAFPMTSDYEYIMDQLRPSMSAPSTARSDLTRTSTTRQARARRRIPGRRRTRRMRERLRRPVCSDNDRPRSIILATDNIVNGNQSISSSRPASLRSTTRCACTRSTRSTIRSTRRRGGCRSRGHRERVLPDGSRQHRQRHHRQHQLDRGRIHPDPARSAGRRSAGQQAAAAGDRRRGASRRGWRARI